MTDRTLETVDLLTRRQLSALVGLRPTALKTALKTPDAPVPIVINARVYRYQVEDVVEWLRKLQSVPRALPDASDTRGSGTDAAPRRRGGRPRVHLIAGQN
jgi:hypothetical protein